MKKTYENVMAELDANQRSAACIGENAVIAAGAGSGKTRVLAARYLHLVIERGIPVDEILTLTFTRKAASEMYGRIYSTLRDTDHPLAEGAVNDFYLARIDTIDAFCNSVARNACRRYGIAPDFSIDNDRAKLAAEELALKFFLEKRKSPAIRQLMKRYSLAELPSRLFADTAMRYSTISSPPDFAAWLDNQSKEIAERFGATSKELARGMERMAALAQSGSKTGAQVASALDPFPDMPEEGDASGLSRFIARCDRLAAIALPGRATEPSLAELKEILSDFKKKLYPEFLSIANYVLNRPFVEETMALLSEFQERFNELKRQQGILTFPDVSRLALDALIDDPELRSAYKSSTSAIMIDEFQDDNALQRDLLFLIAEKEGRMDRSVPGPDELCPDKLFFVGDEKQSIYRFRGADVSVFRALARDLAPAVNAASENGTARPDLRTNYRSESGLIESFNRIFPFVFINKKLYPDGKEPMYEAAFSPIGSSRHTEGLTPSIDILLVNEDNFSGEDPLELPPDETEAAEVARRIRELIDSGFPVRDGDRTRTCEPDDIAILFRSGTRQHLYERSLREAGIPSQSETLRGLFTDAPINDLYALLRLAVYPEDNTAYAMVLRSPFVAIGDLAFTAAMLARVNAEGEGKPVPAPFAEGAESDFDPEDAESFRRGRTLFAMVQSMADRAPATELITRLWYGEGYRYELLADPALHRYMELQDYFFELARQSDERGETLATFLDRIQELMRNGDKIEGLDIPAERSGGVRLMTVHKSKGLEFPVVFLVDSGNEGRGTRNDAPVFFSEESGISVNSGGAEEAENARANYFYEKGREEERNREQAELRRLLYVAMTRAETRLFISGRIQGGSEESDLRSMVADILDRKDKNADTKGTPVVNRSFLDLLFPAILADDLPGVAVGEILPARRVTGAIPRMNGAGNVVGSPHETSAKETAELYESLPRAEYPPSPRSRYSANSLHEDPVVPERTGIEKAAPDALDGLLRKTGVSPNDFGTFAHRTIESRFTGNPVFMPEEIRKEAERMADRFAESALGGMASKATWRKTEYGFITRYVHEGRPVAVTGQMDLLFEFEGTVYVVDYKTDRAEDPSVHEEQLAVYRKAAADLTKKPVETWLYYLRNGHAVKVAPKSQSD